MNDLFLNEPYALTMSTREIAELTGKELSHIHRDVRLLLDELSDDPNLDHVREDKDSRGYTTAFHLPKRECTILVSGYSVQLRARIIDRWQELESQAKKPQSFDPATLSRMDILKLAMEAEQGRLQAVAERDEAIRTKAMIGSKREATAMATAAKAKAEAAKLNAELGFCAHHATIKVVQQATGTEYDWLPMRRWCKAHGVPPKSVTDPLYGAVKAWPAQAWRACHDIDLWVMFGDTHP